MYLLPDLGPWLFVTLTALLATGVIRISLAVWAAHLRLPRVEIEINLPHQPLG